MTAFLKHWNRGFMKRKAEHTEESALLKCLDQFPASKSALERINNTANAIDTLWERTLRKRIATSTELKVKSKVCRVYVHHTFVPSTPDERSHFIITIEGRVLDKVPSPSYHFGQFFDTIRIQIDKKHNTQHQVYEWTAAANSKGHRSDVFQFLVYGDRTCPIKIYLNRSSYARRRYDVSPALRSFLPNLRGDITEDEILLTVWNYIYDYQLLDSKDKPYIRASPELRAVLGVDVCPVSQLRSKLAEHIQPAKPIVIDYTLTARELPLPYAITTSADVIRSGGVVLDVDVDAFGTVDTDILAIINEARQQEEKCSNERFQTQLRLQYMSDCITRKLSLAAAYRSLAANPLSISELGHVTPNVVQTDASVMSHEVISLMNKSKYILTAPQRAEMRNVSALHGMTSFMDIGDDALFDTIVNTMDTPSNSSK